MKLAKINGQTGHRIKWEHFNILATGQSDIHSKIKETLMIRDLKPALNENVGSEKLLLLYQPFIFFPADITRSVYFLIRLQSLWQELSKVLGSYMYYLEQDL